MPGTPPMDTHPHYAGMAFAQAAKPASTPVSPAAPTPQAPPAAAQPAETSALKPAPSR